MWSNWLINQLLVISQAPNISCIGLKNTSYCSIRTITLNWLLDLSNVQSRMRVPENSQCILFAILLLYIVDFRSCIKLEIKLLYLFKLSRRTIRWSCGVKEVLVVLSALWESLSFALDNVDDGLSIILEEFVGLVSQTPSTHSVFSHIPILSHEILVLLSSALTGSGFVNCITLIPTRTVITQPKTTTIVFSENIMTMILQEQRFSIIGLV